MKTQQILGENHRIFAINRNESNNTKSFQNKCFVLHNLFFFCISILCYLSVELYVQEKEHVEIFSIFEFFILVIFLQNPLNFSRHFRPSIKMYRTFWNDLELFL